MRDAYSEATSATTPNPKQGGGSAEMHQQADLVQLVPEYPWASFRGSFLCSCFGFVLQLVLLGCCGSLLLGFNISLLNTALPAINSAFELCGRLEPEAELIYRVARTSSLQSALATCQNSNYCVRNCGKFDEAGTLISFSCSGGYTDIGCENIKWYNAFLSCAVLIGGAFGSMTAGRFMGYGRRVILIVDMLIFAVGVICSVCSNSFSALMWARLVVGYAVGVASVVCPTFMSEMTPRHKRGKFGVFHQLFITVGILVPILLGFPLVNPSEQNPWWEPSSFQQFWWRFMLGLGILPVILGLYLLIFVFTFETPVWYVEQHRYRDASAILQRIYEKEDVHEELDGCIDNVRAGAEVKKQGLTFTRALANPEYRWVIFVGLGLAGFQQFGGINVFITSSSDLFRKAGLNSQMQVVMSIIMAVINVLMTFPTIVLIERMGRKSLLLTGSALQFLCVVPAAISYLIEKDPETPSEHTKILAIFAVLGFVTFFAVAFGPVVWVYLFEIYPMEIKDIAAGVATAFNWFSGIIMVFVAIVVPNQVGFMLFAILQLFGTLFVFFFMRETRGRPLGDSPFITKKEQVAV